MKKINNGDSGQIAAQTIYDNDMQAVLQWRAEAFPATTVVIHQGVLYNSSSATLSTDVPGIASVWVKIGTNLDTLLRSFLNGDAFGGGR